MLDFGILHLHDARLAFAADQNLPDLVLQIPRRLLQAPIPGEPVPPGRPARMQLKPAARNEISLE
jgi:hypothetical protein